MGSSCQTSTGTGGWKTGSWAQGHRNVQCLRMAAQRRGNPLSSEAAVILRCIPPNFSRCPPSLLPHGSLVQRGGPALQRDGDQLKDLQKFLLKPVPSRAHLLSSPLWFLCSLLRKDTDITARGQNQAPNTSPSLGSPALSSDGLALTALLGQSGDAQLSAARTRAHTPWQLPWGCWNVFAGAGSKASMPSQRPKVCAAARPISTGLLKPPSIPQLLPLL